MEIDLEEEFQMLKLGLLCVSLEKGYLLKKLEIESYLKALNSIDYKQLTIDFISFIWYNLLQTKEGVQEVMSLD